MLVLDKLAYNVLNIYSGGRSTNNEHVDLRQIKEWIHEYRALYVRRDLSTNRRYREFEQAVTTPLSTVTTDIPGNPTVKRTAVLPRLVRLKDQEAVIYAGTADGFTPWQVVDENSARWRTYGKYTSEEPIVFVKDDRVYVQNAPEGSQILIRGIFENPEELQEFLISQGDAGETDPWLYPLPRDMAESVVKNILETEMGITKQSPLDLQANTVPDEKVNPPQEA